MTPPEPPPAPGPPEAEQPRDAHEAAAAAPKPQDEQEQEAQPTPPEFPATPGQHTLRYAGRTDPGLMRSNNEDSFVVGQRLMAVADGMGGHAAGEVASKLVVDALAPLNSGTLATDPITALADATRTGNTAIAHLVARHPELEGMGTTVTALLFDGRHVALAHVGDSRGYLYRSGVLHQLTHDDTFVQSLVDEGRITEQQAHEHPQRNLVLRALTGIPVEPLLTARETAAGDRYLLCSDGLCGVVGAEAIADVLAEPDLETAADTLIDLALAAGGPDNVTVVVIDVVTTGVRVDDTAPLAAVLPDDPSSTSPIAQLTREMPRVPLPPIPEEPAAEAEILDETENLDEEMDLEDDADDAAESEDDEDDGAEREPGDETTPPRRATSGRVARAARSEKRRWYRRGAVLVAGLVLLAAAGIASTIWVRHQYYVSDQGNLVVVFRGVNGSLLGWDFSTFEETSCAGETDCSPMKVSDLQPSARNQVQAGIKASSVQAARTVVQRLSEQLLPPCPEPSQPAGEASQGSADPQQTSETTPATRPTIESPPPTSTSTLPHRTTEPPPPPSTPEATDLPPATQVPGVTCRIIT